MSVQLARMAVLYEDLKLEFQVAEADSMPALDVTSLETRRFYFVRRSLGTISEIVGAVHKLNSNKDFKALRQWWEASHIKGWDEAVKFFATNNKFLKDWRNNVGGHFLDRAAEYAIDNIEPTTTGLIELHRTENGAGVRMKFAYDLVAVALTKNREDREVDKFLVDAFTFLVDATRHASTAVQIVVSEILLDKFK